MSQVPVLEGNDNKLPKLDVEGSSPFARSSRLVSYCHTPAEKYHNWPQPSCSRLQLLRKSPLRFYHTYERGQRSAAGDSSGFAFGTLFHELALLLSSFWSLLHVAPKSVCTATGAISEARAKEWVKDIPPGEYYCSPNDERQLREMWKCLMRNSRVRQLIEDREDAEFNCVWTMNGYQVRGRIDGRTPYCLFDWKTTRIEVPSRDWIRDAITKYMYHMQAAMYMDAMDAMGMDVTPMRFIVTSTTWPHECAVITLPQHAIDAGRKLCIELLDELESRRAWDFWQRYETEGDIEAQVPHHWL